MTHRIVLAVILLFVLALLHAHLELTLWVRIGLFIGSAVAAYWAMVGMFYAAGVSSFFMTIFGLIVLTTSVKFMIRFFKMIFFEY